MRHVPLRKGRTEEEASWTGQECKLRRCRGLHRGSGSDVSVEVVPHHLGCVAMRYFGLALVGMAVRWRVIWWLCVDRIRVCLSRCLWTVAMFLLPLCEGLVSILCVLALLSVKKVRRHGKVKRGFCRRFLGFGLSAQWRTPGFVAYGASLYR
jgi:hypothetical protein